MNSAYLAGYLAAESGRTWGTAASMAAAPPQPARHMPPRAAVRNNNALAYGFDLPPALRAMTSFQAPLSHNYFLNAAGQQIAHTSHTRPHRSTWQEDHKVYAWELVQFAMLQLNRPVERRDFPAITEAIHRVFQGTVNATGEEYPLRGFNTVHSMVTKHPGWAEFCRYLLP
jgi:hypothetical protein